ncbi:counting factor 60-like [Clytia hemisphaerica]|uniref:counting factor 60-like n=1 Tax=Clytia hemisphaerica TaxID=252671 RepID=UPI0034D50E7A|eukprot:TCONS_00054862-protein
MLFSLLINHVRRRRYLVACVFIGFLFLYLLKTSFFQSSTQEDFENLVTSYCNSPREVNGDEADTIDGLQLVQLQILIRHGDRAPINIRALPNTSPVHIPCKFNLTGSDFHNKLREFENVVNKNVFEIKGSKHTQINEERALCYGGQLTPRGILQHMYLGEHLRESYTVFLQEVNDISSDVHILSTDLPRTKQSVAALMIGMFYMTLIKEAPKVTINVHADHLKDTHLSLDMNGAPLDCQNVDKKWSELLHGLKWARFNKDIHTNLENIAAYLSTDMEKLPAFNKIVDTFYTRACHGLGIPSGPHYTLPLSLIEQSFGFAHRYSTLRHSGELAELQALPLLSQIATHIVNVLKHPDKAKKLVFYSGHDSMIHPVLQLLNEEYTTWPPYASRIVFEIYTDENVLPDDKELFSKAYFRVLYNGQTLDEIKFIGAAKGPMRLYSLSGLLTYLSDRPFDELKKYEVPLLNEHLYSKIEKLCSSK